MSAITHFGGAIFRWVLQTTWQAAVLAGLILLAQWLLRKRLSEGWRYGLWLLLVVRLLMPATPQSALSIFNLVRASPAQPVEFSSSMAVSGPYSIVNSFNGSPSTNVYTKPIELRPPPTPPGVIVINPPVKLDWFRIAFGGWLVGVCFFGTQLVWINARFRSRIAGHQPIADETVTRLFNECRAALKITGPVRLIESEEVESPAVYGLWRKWLLLPDGALKRFTTEELRCIVLHELAHIKRGDLGVNWIVSVLQAVHWFNPALWLAFARMRADRELATDARALAHVAATENVAYGETILKIVENLANSAARPGLVGIAESKAGLKDRLRTIAHFGKTRPWRWAAVMLAVAIAGVGLTDARQPATPADSVTRGALKQAEISGTVVDPGGRPVGNVQVALFQRKSRPEMTGEYIDDSDLYLTGQPRLFNPASGHVMGEPRLVPWNYCITDRKGRFYLDDLQGSVFLLAANESGFARISTNDFSTNMTIKLEPWGRIEGTVWLYDQIVTNASVMAAMNDDGTAWSRGTKFETRTDDHGHFEFDFVLPGKFAVLGSGLRENAVVKSAETAVVKIGGSGRPVVGKFKIRNPYIDIEWGRDRDLYRLGTVIPEHPQGFNSEEEHISWRKRPEVAAALEKFQFRDLQIANDGSFRIDQVDLGTYNLWASIRDPRVSSWSNNFIAEYKGTFEIPASKSNAHEPFDLGTIEISLKPEK